MGRPFGSTKAVHIRNYPHCLDCGIKLGNYRSKKCVKHSKVSISRPDMIGHPKWNFTKWDHKAVMTDEVKQKISEAKKGISMSAENRAKIAAASKRGSEHHNWKDGSQVSRGERVRFNRYFQPKVLARDNYTCQICDQYSGNLQVDHIKKWSDYPELRFDLDNCRTLCMACHYYITFKRKLPQGVIWGHNLSRRIG